MPTHLTEQQLRAAWAAMRTRRCLSAWPDSFEVVMADPQRGQLVRLEALAAARAAAGRLTRPCQPVNPIEHHAPPPTHQQPYRLDRKKAAAGDRDD